MPIIDNAVAGAQPQAQPQPPMQAGAAAPQQGQGPQKMSETGKDVLLAVYGMLYDKRVAVGEKLAQQIQSSKDPVSVIANSAYDIVMSASEKLGVELPPPEMRAVVKVALARIGEIGKAVGVPLSGADAEKAIAVLAERAGAGQGQPQQPAPEQQEIMQ